MYLNWHSIYNVETYPALYEELFSFKLFSFQLEKWLLFLTFQDTWNTALLDAEIIYKVTLGCNVLLTHASVWNGLNKILNTINHYFWKLCVTTKNSIYQSLMCTEITEISGQNADSDSVSRTQGLRICIFSQSSKWCQCCLVWRSRFV